MFIDGVYQSNRSAISLGILDVERIEVIKGPVSALYGRNAYAGVLNYVTRKPVDYLEASGTVGFGSADQRSIQASVGVPIARELSMRLTAGHDKSDGTYEDAVNGLTAGGYRKDDLNFALRFTPTPLLNMVGSLYYGDDFFKNPPLAYMDNNCGLSRPVFGVVLFQQKCGKLDVTTHPIEVAALNPNTGAAGNRRRVTASTLKMTYDYGFAEASALLGFNKVVQQRFADFTGHRDGIPFLTTPNPPGTLYNLKEYFGGDNNNTDYSMEFRLASKLDQPLRWSGGLYWFNANNASSTLIGADGSSLPAGVTLPPGSTGSLFLTPDGSFSKSNFTLVGGQDRIFSPFGSLEYDVIPSLTGALELRHTREDKSQNILRNAFIANTVNPIYPFGPTYAEYSFSNYRTSLRYKLSPDAMVYLSAADGTKSGGFNQRATFASEVAFNPEKNTTFELGSKASFLERRLQLGAALFHTRAKDVQISGPSDDPTNIGLVTKNLASVKATGLDLDIAAIPVRGLTLSGGLGYVNPKIGSGSYDFGSITNNGATTTPGTTVGGPTPVAASGDCTVIPLCAGRLVQINVPVNNTYPTGKRYAYDLSGLMAPRASKITATVSAQYDTQLFDTWAGFGRVDFRYESKQYSAPNNFNYWDARKVVNLSAGLSKDRYRFGAYIRNLNNDKTPDAATPNGLINGSVTPWVAYLPEKRTIGVTASIYY